MDQYKIIYGWEREHCHVLHGDFNTLDHKVDSLLIDAATWRPSGSVVGKTFFIVMIHPKGFPMYTRTYTVAP